MYIDYLETPIGYLEISASPEGVSSIVFSEGVRLDTVVKSAMTESCRTQLREYFEGRRRVFDLPLAPKGTDFQQSVWRSLQTTPYGKTASYRDIALSINNPKAVRAVGAANGKNPISIVVPCHRIIGSNGTMTGYAGGLERKRWLLKHEGLGDFDT